MRRKVLVHVGLPNTFSSEGSKDRHNAIPHSFSWLGSPHLRENQREHVRYGIYGRGNNGGDKTQEAGGWRWFLGMLVVGRDGLGVVHV